jgi:DNA-binding SARP family transcriptional activator
MKKRTASGSALSLRVLGEVSIERNGQRLALPPSKKTRALLGYLLVEPREHSREQLCSLFWDAPDDPRGALRWSLSRLRPLLDEPGSQRLIADRERVRLDPLGASIDLRTVEALQTSEAEADELQRTELLFRGELLEGLELSEAFRFQAWCTARREEARRLHAQLLRRLCAKLEPQRALPVARRLVELDPGDEAAHRHVMELLGALGRPKEARLQYDACREILRTTLGANPSAETEAARRALGVGQPQLQPEEPAPPRPRVSLAAASSPLVAREAALAAVLRELEARPQVVAILGEPGIGKSRLLEELGARAVAAGTEVLQGRSYEAEQARPYGCFVDALRGSQLVAQAGAVLRQELSPLLSELGPMPPAQDRTRLFDAVAVLLREGARKRPLLLLLDDAHWIDEASTGLLHYVARSVPEVRIAVAARAGEWADNPAAVRLRRALRREERESEVMLDPFDATGVAALLRSRGLAADAAQVHAQSEGNALLALEIGRALDEGRPLLSGGLAEALEQRLSGLDQGAQSLLSWAAALGGALEATILAAATGQSFGAIIEELAALERHGLLRQREGGLYEVSHDLLREAAYRRIPAARRVQLHQGLARALWALHEAQPVLAGAAARQALLAGEHALAVRASLVAARHALQVFASDEALAHAERALPLVNALPREERLRARLSLLEVCVYSKRRPDRLEKVAMEVSRLVLEAQAAGDASVVADGFFVLSQSHYFREDEGSAMTGSLRALAVARQDPDPLVRARALAQAGRCLAQIELDVPQARALLEEAALAAAGASAQLTDLPFGRGLVHAFCGEGAEARQALEAAAAHANELGDHWRSCEARFALCRLAFDERDFPRALACARESLAVAEKMTGGSERAEARTLLALAQQQAGEPGDELWRAGCDELRSLEARWRLVPILLIAAELRLAAGRTDEAQVLALAAGELGTGNAIQMRHRRAYLVLAEVALARGDGEKAREQLTLALAAPGGMSAPLQKRITAAAARAGLTDSPPVHTLPPTQAG